MEGWIPALSTATLLSVAAWLGRNAILARLTASIRFEFDAKLEELRAIQKRNDLLLSSTIRSQESELAALRDGPLSLLTSRQGLLDKRRLEAVDQLWGAVIALRPAKIPLPFMAVIKFDEAAARTETEPKLREFFKTFGGTSDFNSIDQSDAAKARPYISAPAWASYTAIVSILGFTWLRLNVLRTGAPSSVIANSSALNTLLKAALPEQATFIDEADASAYPVIVEQLEAKLLRELQDDLSGGNIDAGSLERAATILTKAQQIQKDSASREIAANPEARTVAT